MTLLEQGLLPDGLIRAGIRARLSKKIRTESAGGPEAEKTRRLAFLERSAQSPIAVHTEDANEQHYELPAAFFQKIMGRHMKYSSGIWNEGVSDIDRSEEDMLLLTLKRADIRGGQRILELGCGWGSLSLYMAACFPQSHITAVSNSHSQKKFIDQRATERGLKNLTVLTAEMSRLELPGEFDRVVSVEMFEHMRNYAKLFKKVAGFLKPSGKMFVHVFAHSRFAYFYEQEDPEDWIARYFFTGGTMPSHDLFGYFQEDFSVAQQWKVSGRHYQKTCRAWLDRMDAGKKDIVPILKDVYGGDHKKWWNYWRVFFMSCEELFGYRRGEEWLVSHTLFSKR